MYFDPSGGTDADSRRFAGFDNKSHTLGECFAVWVKRCSYRLLTDHRVLQSLTYAVQTSNAADIVMGSALAKAASGMQET